MAALLELPNVQGLFLRKPLAPAMPVEVGVARRGALGWWFGKSLFDALDKAHAALTPGPTVVENGHG
jgi:hypothetical protein